MELGLKITCPCHQVELAICCQTPPVVPVALKEFRTFETCVL